MRHLPHEALDLAGHTDEALEVVSGEVGTLGERPERSTFDAFDRAFGVPIRDGVTVSVKIR